MTNRACFKEMGFPEEMRIPLWIGCPAVIALSVVDAALEIQTRAVGALTRGPDWQDGHSHTCAVV